MASSDEEQSLFNLAGEMRSISVRAVTKKKGKVTMLVMDQENCNEVIALLKCDVSTGMIYSLDRNNQPAFTADCGIRYQNRNDIILYVDQSKEKVPHTWRVQYLLDNRWMANQTPISKTKPNRQLTIEQYRHPSAAYWVYTVTNKLNEEVCIMRSKIMTTNITYFKSMENEAKLLLLSFSAKRHYIDFNLIGLPFPDIEISGISPSTSFANRQDKVDEHHSVDFAALLDVIIHRAGYNKALGIHYYDFIDRNTGNTQLTFEVSLEDLQNVTAVIKDRSGTAIMTASKLLRELTITLMSDETFTFEDRDTFNVHYPRFYDTNGKIFLEARRSIIQSTRRGGLKKYTFYRSENNKDNESHQAAVFNKGPNSTYAVFPNPMLDAKRKVIILAYAMRASFLDYDSHTVVMPVIDYCYSRKD